MDRSLKQSLDLLNQLGEVTKASLPEKSPEKNEVKPIATPAPREKTLVDALLELRKKADLMPQPPSPSSSEPIFEPAVIPFVEASPKPPGYFKKTPVIASCILRASH